LYTVATVTIIVITVFFFSTVLFEQEENR